MTSNGDLTMTLARFVAEQEGASLPSHSIARTQDGIIDTVGVMSAGSRLGRGVREIIDVVTEDVSVETATVIGRSQPTSVRAAAIANASMTHQLDFDDTHDQAVVHPTANSLPISMALAEALDLDGRALLEAVLVGNEVTCRLGEALTRPMFDYPWVRPPVIGMFGAVAAACRIMSLSADEVANAWGLLLPRVGGTLACLVEPGSWVRTMRDAFSTESAYMAMQLARRGVQGDRRPLEGPLGLFNSYFNGDYDSEILTDGLGQSYLADRISIKPWPCCREVHCTLTALFDTMDRHAISGEQVDSVEVKVGQTNIELCEPAAVKRHPRLTTDALCNIPFNVAVGTVYGRIPIDAYSDRGLADATVAAMADRVSWVVDEAQNRQGTLEPGAVEIRLTDGSTISGEADIALGHPEFPMSRKQLAAKFHSCWTAGPGDSSTAERLLDLLSNLENVTVNDVTECLRP